MEIVAPKGKHGGNAARKQVAARDGIGDMTSEILFHNSGKDSDKNAIKREQREKFFFLPSVSILDRRSRREIMQIYLQLSEATPISGPIA